MGNVAIILLAAVLLLLSPRVMQAAADAAEVFVRGVLPALFPMMILNGMARGTAARSALPKWAEGALTVLFAFMAGSPASAQRLADARQQGRWSQGQLWALAGAAGVMSPMFFTGTLAGAAGDGSACWVMLIAHWLGALAVGGGTWMVYRLRQARLVSAQGREQTNAKGTVASVQAKTEPNTAVPVQAKTESPAAGPTPAALLPAAVSSAAQALLSVCGAMMLFSVAACVLRACITVVLPGTSEKGLAVLWALLEVGGGCHGVLNAFPRPPYALLCALCSFGGLSIWLQNLLFLGKSIRPGGLLLLRGLHGAVSYGICTLLLTLAPQTAAVFASAGAGGFTVRLPAAGLLLCLLALLPSRP